MGVIKPEGWHITCGNHRIRALWYTGISTVWILFIEYYRNGELININPLERHQKIYKKHGLNVNQPVVEFEKDWMNYMMLVKKKNNKPPTEDYKKTMLKGKKNIFPPLY